MFESRLGQGSSFGAIEHISCLYFYRFSRSRGNSTSMHADSCCRPPFAMWWLLLLLLLLLSQQGGKKGRQKKEKKGCKQQTAPPPPSTWFWGETAKGFLPPWPRRLLCK
jgi:hypothetical protein